MKVTALTPQVSNDSRVNVMIDGKYRFSLDLLQISDLGIKVGNEYTESELELLEQESQFGKLYVRAMEYSFVRPRSCKEMRDYLYKKTLTKRTKNRKTGQIYDKPGVSKGVADRVYDRLVQKGYVDDYKFTKYWVENRNLSKGISVRKISSELISKGVSRETIDEVISEFGRSDIDELQKVLNKAKYKYSDENKLIQYLMRKGFSYGDIKDALSDVDN